MAKSNKIGYTQIQNEPTGFQTTVDSTIEFDNGLMRFTILPVSDSFDYYIKGTKHTVSTPQTVDITDTEGGWFFYFDGDVLTATQVFNIDILYGKGYVANIYWDATNKIAIMFGEERHGLTMDWATHVYLHTIFGAQYSSGLSMSGYTLDTDDVDALTIGITNGSIRDEDITLNIADGVAFEDGTQPLVDASQIPVFYRDGNNGDWRKDDANNYYFKNTIAGRVNYNEYTGSTWQQTEVTDDSHVAYFICATNNIWEPIIAIQGQREDVVLEDAENNNSFNSLLFGALPFKEFKIIYVVFIKTQTSLTNAKKAKVMVVNDVRQSSNAGVAATPIVGSHSGLLELNYTSSGHTGFASQAVADLKADIDANDYLLAKQVYGGMYEFTEAGSPITITNAGTYYQWITQDGNSVAGTDYLEYDGTNKQLIIKKAGWYDVGYKSVVFAPSGHQIKMGIFRTPDGESAAILPAHQGLMIMPAADHCHPSSFDATNQIGILTGDVSLLRNVDHLWVTGTEINGAPGFIYSFIFSCDNAPDFFRVWAKYIHTSNHYKKWSAYDFNLASWVDFISVGNVTDDLKDIGVDDDSFREYKFPSGTFHQGGQVKVRLTHYSSGNVKDPSVYFDQLAITPKVSRLVDTVNYPILLNVDDRLDFRYTSNVNGDTVYSVATSITVNKIGE